jgi:cytoskeletal protein CcmA (bactofilin family)
MFRKQNRSKREIRTLIGAGTRVNGDVVFTEGLHVDGVVRGNVSTEDDSPGALSVSEKGVIEGDVTVPDLVLDGTVKGNVEARERVELGPTARVIGDVVYNLIEMAIGAEVNGQLIHQAPGGAEKPGSSPAAGKSAKKNPEPEPDTPQDSLERS